MKRLLWLDISKGLAILFVAYFHFFRTYFEHGILPPADWSGLAAGAVTILRLVWFKVSELGSNPVAFSTILSAWTRTQPPAPQPNPAQSRGARGIAPDS